MKFKVNNGNEFEPFDITLRVENEEEARLLWHVFNRRELTHVIFEHPYTSEGEEYIRPIIESLGDDSEGDFIRSEIEKRVKIR